MATIPVYARSALLVLLLGIGIAWFVLIGVLICIFCCASSKVAQSGGRAVAVVAALFIVATQCLTMVGFALIAGFGAMPQAVSFLLSACLWIPTLMITLNLTSTAWRTSLLVAKGCRRSGGREEGGLGQDESHRIGPMASIRSLWRASFSAAMQRPIVYLIASFIALGVTLAVNLGLSQVCFCTNPTSITTWTSRRSDNHPCLANHFCHLYPVMGETSATMRIVGHLVVDDIDLKPHNTWATWCETSSANPHACILGANAMQRVESKLIDYAHIQEDLRFLSHTVLTNLTGETYYKVHVFFDGGASREKALVFQTPPDPNSTSTVRIFSGGDVHQGAQFTNLIKAAIKAETDPHLILIGGDLSYANNMRTCYLRWDWFLKDLSTTRKSRGEVSIPIVTIPGNHESGGYLHWSDRADYLFYTQYFPQYDDDQVVGAPTSTSAVETVKDSTITYHRHLLGNRLELLCVDTGLMISVDDQIPYITQSLEMAESPATPANKRFVIVAQHNPMFPAFRDISSGPTEEMRSKWMPLYDKYKVPFVLEYHDHSYKRTWPMLNGQVSRNDGTVFVGDGALGVFSDRIPDASRPYLRKTYAGNYINVIHVLSNGTTTVRTLGSTGMILDSFSLLRRV